MLAEDRPGERVMRVKGGDPATDADWHALARCGLTLVVYMGVARVQCIARALRAGGLAGSTPAAVVSSANSPQQRQAVCTLGSLADTVARERLASPAILVIGDVVQASPLWDAAPRVRPDADRPAASVFSTPEASMTARAGR